MTDAAQTTADRTPPNRTPLTRQSVLEGAVDLVDEHGLDALTMRKLGQRLNRDAMTLYRYVPSRAALLDGVVEVLYEEVAVDTRSGSWSTALRTFAHDFRQLCLRHAHAVPLLVTRPLHVPLGLRPLSTLRPLEAILGVLTNAGFTAADALHVYRAYLGILYGHVLAELQEVVVAPEETDDLLRLGLHRLPISEFPLLRSLAADLSNYDGVAELDSSLAILLAGLDAQLATR